MNKNIKIILAAASFLGAIIIIVVFYFASVVLHKIPHTALIVASIIAAIDILVAVMFLRMPSKSSEEALISKQPSIETSHYSDNLIDIDSDGITIKHFYFPFAARKRIDFRDVKTVRAFTGGCMRLWGSGDFRTWFGIDWNRMNRKMTFVIEHNNSWFKTGFTCKDSDTVAQILKSKNLLNIKS